MVGYGESRSKKKRVMLELGDRDGCFVGSGRGVRPDKVKSGAFATLGGFSTCLHHVGPYASSGG